MQHLRSTEACGHCRHRTLATLALGLLLLAGTAQAAAAEPNPAQAAAASSADATEIQALLKRYAQAWYEANAKAMAEVLHPQFVRHTIRRAAGKVDVAEQMSGLELLDFTERGYGQRFSPSERKAEGKVLQIDGSMGVAVLKLADRTEQLQLARWNHRWRIVGVLTEGAQS